MFHAYTFVFIFIYICTSTVSTVNVLGKRSQPGTQQKRFSLHRVMGISNRWQLVLVPMALALAKMALKLQVHGNPMARCSFPEVFRSKTVGFGGAEKRGEKNGKVYDPLRKQHYQEAFPKGNSSSNSSVLGSISVYRYRVPRCISSWWIVRIIHVLPLFSDMMPFDRCLFFKRVPKPSTKFVEGGVSYGLPYPYPGPDPALNSSLHNHQARIRVKQL